MAKGRGFEFGDAGSDKIVLYAVLGLIGYTLLKLGPGLNAALSGAGSGLGAAGNVAQALADAVNTTTQAVRDAANTTRAGVYNLTSPSGAPYMEPDGSLWEPYDPATYQGSNSGGGATGGW